MKLPKILAIILLLVSLVGCGGGHKSQNSRSASVTISIRWSKPTRLIPFASNWVYVEAFDGSTLVARDAIKKQLDPSDQTYKGTITFSDMPTTNIRFTARAYFSSLDDKQQFISSVSGFVAMAAGETTKRLISGTNNPIVFEPASTIKNIIVKTENVSLGQTKDIEVPLAYNGDPNAGASPVLMTLCTLTWESDNPAVALVRNVPVTLSDGTQCMKGTVEGLTSGTAKLTVTDSESKIRASGIVVVSTDSPVITVTVAGVPPYAESVHVKVTDTTATPPTITEKTAPVSGASSVDVPVQVTNRGGNPFEIVAEAWSGPSRTGGKYSESDPKTISISAGSQTASTSVDLNSRIQNIAISPTISSLIVIVGGSLQLSVTAYSGAVNPANEIAPIPAQALSWSRTNGTGSISNPNVNPKGLISGQSAPDAGEGTATVNVTDGYSGKSASRSVTVRKNTATGNISIN